MVFFCQILFIYFVIKNKEESVCWIAAKGVLFGDKPRSGLLLLEYRIVVLPRSGLLHREQVWYQAFTPTLPTAKIKIRSVVGVSDHGIAKIRTVASRLSISYYQCEFKIH